MKNKSKSSTVKAPIKNVKPSNVKLDKATKPANRKNKTS